jgi:transcriptional regulator with XRE-family HTH domain
MNTQETLRNALQATGLNQRQLAEKYEIPLRSFEAWLGGTRKPPVYVVNLLLRCLAVDFPTKSALSEQPEPVTKQSEPIFCDQYTKKPLSAELAKIAREEFEAGKVQLLKEYEQDFYGDLVESKRRRKGKIYRCTNSDYDPDREIPMGFEFLVITEEV